MTTAPRVALVSVRFALFDAQMPPDFRGRMLAHVDRSTAILREHFEVVTTELIEDEDGAARVRDALRDARVEAVVFAPAMAAPPRYAEVALSALPAEMPLVVWNAPSITRLGPDLDQATATQHSTTVGAVMYANVLVREGRPAAVVTASHADPEGLQRLIRTVRAVAAAGSLRGATVLRVGDPIPGYTDVEASTEDLADLGLREVAIDRDAWADAVEAVSPGAGDQVIEEARGRGWEGDPGAAAARSGQVAVALRAALDRERAVCGTVNCHGPWFRRERRVGVVACLGVVMESERGRPIACTGDQPTAIVLYLARRIAGAALYSECYAPELESDLMLVAGGGEGDPAWADTDAGGITLLPNRHYPGEAGEGASIEYVMRTGPATLLSLSPTRAGWVIAWATGEVTESRYRGMRGPNAMFRFDSGAVGDATSRWIGSGATHHNALAPGRLDVEVPALATALRIRAVRV
jgi:L-arabinose isomerase